MSRDTAGSKKWALERPVGDQPGVYMAEITCPGTRPGQREEHAMPAFVFTYRIPTDYVPGRPDTMAAWTAWFASMGDSLSDRGNPVFESAELGNCGKGTRLGGYSFVTADDLDSALALAKGSPALDAGGGLEVGVVTVLHADSPSSGQG
jgi:hypothetical protein